MANIAGFNAANYGEMQTFSVIPAHKAVMMITASEMKPTKDGTGQRLSLTAEIIGEGQYKGRKLFIGLNMVNKNKQAEDIAARELAAICKAVGILTPTDSTELHNKPFIGDIGVKPAKAAKPAGNGFPAKDAQPEQNVMNGYEPVGGSGTVSLAAPAGAPPAAPAAAAAAPATAPWLVKK